MKKVDFYEACWVPTSLYDERYAKLNTKWLIANKIYNQEEKEGYIPKRLHFIWLGSELPTEYQANIDTWIEHNPKHEVFVWTDDEVDKIMDVQEDRIKDMFESAKNFGQKSDILRYVILYNFGGIYSDIDFICLGDFSDLENVNFFAGICLERDFQLNNGLMACSPKHKILENILERITIDGYEEIECPHTRTLYQTGPWALTDSVNKYIFECTECPNDVMFWPPNYFHPFPAAERHDGNWEDYVKDYSLACHLWHCSWQK